MTRRQPKKIIAKTMVKTGCKAPAIVVTCAALPSDLYAAKLHNTPKPFKKPAIMPQIHVFCVKLKVIFPIKINTKEMKILDTINAAYAHCADIKLVVTFCAALKIPQKNKAANEKISHVFKPIV